MVYTYFGYLCRQQVQTGMGTFEANIKSPYWVFDIYYKRFWSFKIHFNSSDFITYNNVEANYLTVGISMYPNHL